MLCCDCRENMLLGHRNEHCFRYLARFVNRDVKEVPRRMLRRVAMMSRSFASLYHQQLPCRQFPAPPDLPCPQGHTAWLRSHDTRPGCRQSRLYALSSKFLSLSRFLF